MNEYYFFNTLEKLFLKGCKVIKVGSDIHKLSEGHISHILVECPEPYRLEREDKERGPLTFIIVELFGHKYHEATLLNGNKSHALKTFDNNLQEDQKMKHIISIKNN